MNVISCHLILRIWSFIYFFYASVLKEWAVANSLELAIKYCSIAWKGWGVLFYFFPQGWNTDFNSSATEVLDISNRFLHIIPAQVL